MMLTLEEVFRKAVLSKDLTPSELRMFAWVALGETDFYSLAISRDTVDRGVSKLRKLGFIEPIGDWWRVKLAQDPEKAKPNLFERASAAPDARVGFQAPDVRLEAFSEAARRFFRRGSEEAKEALRAWFYGDPKSQHAVKLVVAARRAWDAGRPVEWSEALDGFVCEAEKWAAARAGARATV